jgi:GntR family transcriptional repressor for pyruvate dehydrogenase complex
MKKKIQNPSPESLLFSALAMEEKKHISEELFEKLRDAILTGVLPAGYIFPNENDLCQQLNIGRSSLREAYSCLETLHLITRSKTGTYVNELAEIRNSMNFEAIAQRTDIQNLVEYRQLVEVGVARIAAEKGTNRDVQKLEKIICAMREAKDDPIMLSQFDFDFHSKLVRITDNELLVITFNTIRSIYEDFTESVFEKGYFEASLVDHARIVDAIRAHDPEKAGQMMERHLRNVEVFRNSK